MEANREIFLNELNEIIEEYKSMLTDVYIKELLKEKFTQATDNQLDKKVDKHRKKIIEQLDKLIVTSENLTDYDINKYKDCFNKKYKQETRIKNLLFLKDNYVGI